MSPLFSFLWWFCLEPSRRTGSPVHTYLTVALSGTASHLLGTECVPPNSYVGAYPLIRWHMEMESLRGK